MDTSSIWGRRVHVVQAHMCRLTIIYPSLINAEQINSYTVSPNPHHWYLNTFWMYQFVWLITGSFPIVLSLKDRTDPYKTHNYIP